MQILDTSTCKELVTEAIAKFNAVLDKQRPENPDGVWSLDTDASSLEQNYYLYRAKKKGTAKDDPSKFHCVNICRHGALV